MIFHVIIMNIKMLINNIFQMFLHAIENLEFSTIESLWREFWRCQDSLDDCEEERYLSKFVISINL